MNLRPVFKWLNKRLFYSKKFVSRTVRRSQSSDMGTNGENDADANLSRTILERSISLWYSSAGLRCIFVLKFLESIAYFSTSQILTLYLSQDFGLSDVDSGLMYGLYGAMISLYGILFSSQVDKFGVRRSLVLGFLLSAIGRSILAVFHRNNIWLIYLSLFVLLPLSASLGIPVLLIGIIYI
uniref:Major facilitator superfamily (MFS) profile domain-containing protein n=1 Tax=Aplanochytrium stocchinoi TaxID=215587 RepID=A0A7S3LHR3_9STRA